MAPSTPWGALDIIVNPQGGTGFGESGGKAYLGGNPTK